MTNATRLGLCLAGALACAAPAAAQQTNAERQAAAEADKAVADAQKAAYDAQAAAIAAHTAAQTARIGAVTPSGLTGAVELKDSPGKGAATILAAQTLDAVATDIAGKVTAPTVAILASDEEGQFGAWRGFSLRRKMLEDSFATAEAKFAAAQAADHDATAASHRTMSSGGKTYAASVPLPAVGAALSAGANLLSYFQSDYALGDVALTPDNDLLVAAVAGKLQAGNKTVLIPSRMSGTTIEAATSALFDSLAASNRAALANARQADINAKLRQDQAAKAKGARKADLTARAAAWTEAAAAEKAASANFDALITALFTPDAAGVAPIVRVVREQQVSAALSTTGQALFLKASALPAQYYSKKNLWTAFGGMPFYVSGGQVVAYSVMNRDGTLARSGVVVKNSGFKKLSEVAAIP